MKSLTCMAAAMAVAAVSVGCGSGGNGTTSPSSDGGGSGAAAPPPNAVVITIASSNGPQAFAPNPAALQPGQQIVFRNVDSVAHHIVLDNGSLDTGLLATGQSSVAASVAASGAQYHCTIHPSMVGSINEPTATPPADPADPAY